MVESGSYVVWAAGLGALSAVSLPVGSLVGISTSPRSQTISIMAAFGAGALIAALSVELVAPTVSMLNASAEAGGHHGDPLTAFQALLAGLVIGGFAFVVLDQLVNAGGGFLRKSATSVAWYMQAERRRQAELVEHLSQLPGLCSLPPEHINSLVAMVRPVSFHDGELITEQDEDADSIIHVLAGSVSLSRNGEVIRELRPDESLGVAALFANIPYLATAKAIGPVKAIALSRADCDRLRQMSPEFDAACREEARRDIEEVAGLETARVEQETDWARKAARALRSGTSVPTAEELRRARKEHASAPLAVWLGILLDGLPESLVIGAGLYVLLETQTGSTSGVAFADVIPYTLIAGLSLSNYPEALASSANMKLQQWRNSSILLMWSSLVLITSLGTAVGFVVASALDPAWLVFAEGLAAGAMLTMIVSTMIPEAVLMGSAHGVGLGTLAGFISAIAFKLLES